MGHHPNNANDNDLAKDFDGADQEDWTSHHISYPLLRSTLNFFSQRRAGLRARLRDTLNNEPMMIGSNKPKLSEEEFNMAVNEYATQAPFLKKVEDGEGGGDSNLMEYAGQRALGRTPPGGKMKRQRNKKDDDGTETANTNVDLTVADVLVSAACANVVPMGTMDGEGMPNNPCSPYLRMGNSTSNSMLDEAEITKRLSFMERSELSAVLDSEVERAATFYRLRISELAPPRVDGGTCPTFACGGFDCGDYGTEVVTDDRSAASFLDRISVHNNTSEESDELIAPSQDREQLSFTDMASEILELHAFITTNIIVVRQVLIKYDAFVRSLGGTPMGSWYQTTRRQRVKGRSSDFRDLVYHSKLRKLTKAYIHEYKKNSEEAASNANGNGDQLSVGGDTIKRRRRHKGLSKAFYKIVDAGEEMKKRQRMKWRQSAMHLDDDDGDLESVPTSKPPATARSLDDRTRTPLHSIDSIPETPLPISATAAHTPVTTPHARTRRMETPPPEPPLQPPDYSSLRSNPDIGEDIAYQVYIFKCIQSKTQRSIEKTYNGRISGMYDNFISTIREYFLLGNATDNLSLMPEYLVMRGKSLKSTLLVVAQWREARNTHRYGLRGDLTPVDPSQWFGGFCGEAQPQPQCTSFKANLALFLNILACFLYMMNYYIVEPSSTRYANALGMGDAMSGLIIGAMPWAAIFSAVAYSIWSNTNYKSPLLMSGILLTAGNFLYATAYRYESIEMALCGRFLTGLGGPRSMNRRYIADTTPLAQRTAVNAAFGTATALGAALGPATAIMLDNLDVQFDLPLYGTVYLNGMTGPGFLMGMLWILFTLIMALTFEEPDRSGLREQIRKEVSDSSTMSAATKMSVVPDSPARSEYEMSNLDALRYSTPGRQNNFETSMLEGLDRFGCPTEGGRDICDAPSICTGSPGRGPYVDDDDLDNHRNRGDRDGSLWQQAKFISNQITLPVRICMFLLFSKMFTVESVISAASMVTKNRYGWAVHQVGTLGTIVGCLTIPISIFIGWVSQYREDRVLMIWLMSFAAIGMGLLVDVTDMVSTETETYNEGHPLAVGPYRYIAGYLLVFCSVQAFDGVVGSVLSKVIPTALASGTLNSGLLATVIGTFGRACGDVFITSVGYINIRQIMNLLFVPSFVILMLDLVLICYNYDSLTA